MHAGRNLRQQGFTLIEMLVVVLIISIVIGVALIAPVISGPAQRLKDEASRLQVLVEQARERALLEDREYGLSLSSNGYRWWQWSREDEQWQVLGEETFRDYRLADDVSLIDTSHRNARSSLRRKNREKYPEWVIYSDGQMTPVRLELSLKDDTRKTITLESDGLAPVTKN